jgi:ABC-2 type transport system ATP-binding protein
LRPAAAGIIYTYDTQGERTGITGRSKISILQVSVRDLHTTQSSLEDIFVDLVRQRR